MTEKSEAFTEGELEMMRYALGKVPLPFDQSYPLIAKLDGLLASLHVGQKRAKEPAAAEDQS